MTKTMVGMVAALVVLMAFAVAPVAAAKYQELTSLNLVQKDGSWNTTGSIKGSFEPAFSKDSVKFSVSAGLNDGNYVLISYSEPWGTKSNVIATGIVTDKKFTVSTFRYSDLQKNLICNPYPTPTNTGYSGVGAKLWLVPTTDFNVGTGLFTAWNPQNYLFESKLFSTECSLPSVALVQKDSNVLLPNGGYTTVVGGMSGMLVYKADGNAFVFNGQKLVDGDSYTLISYNENWGFPNGILGTGTADAAGKVQVTGTAMPLICNTYTSGEYLGQTGAKIWLVPSNDLTLTGAMAAWNPSTYLFETSLIPCEA